MSKLSLSPDAARRARERIPAWSHQLWLRSLIGKDVFARFIDETGIRGTLSQADNFTVMFEIGGEQTVYFKHAIKSIKPVA